jgi:hypothetical protein
MPSASLSAWRRAICRPPWPFQRSKIVASRVWRSALSTAAGCLKRRRRMGGLNQKRGYRPQADVGNRRILEQRGSTAILCPWRTKAATIYANTVRSISNKNRARHRRTAIDQGRVASFARAEEINKACCDSPLRRPRRPARRSNSWAWSARRSCGRATGSCVCRSGNLRARVLSA